MDDEIDYAEMLEIPVETVTVRKRESRKPRQQTENGDLSEQLVAEVNERMEGAPEEEPATEAEAIDPNFAESKQIARSEKPKKAKKPWAKKLLIGELAAVVGLCAVIFFTNIFMTNSAINTFVRGLFQGNNASAADTREYSDFKLTPVVNDTVDTALTVSETGVLSFTANCSVYSPASGTVKKVNGAKDTGYTVEIKHSEKFSTIISGLDTVYLAEGDKVMNTLPIGYTDGDGAVNVMMYSGDKLLSCYSAENNKLAWI
ncbi:MAG: M23 family metallopeptidase [Clostridia bacterium]|nr:M23 family metallopeptidase [Clostridia bacterium]